jgi:hypothetical protein
MLGYRMRLHTEELVNGAGALSRSGTPRRRARV